MAGSIAGQKMARGGQGSKPSIRPLGAQTDESGSTPRDDTFVIGQSVHVAEIPGFQTGEPEPSHRSNYLKTGPKTRRPAGLAAGADRPRWLRGLGRFFGRAEGGAWPEQNRRWMERERGRRVRRKLQYTKNGKKKTRASAGPAGRTRASQGRQRAGVPCGDRVDRRPVYHPPFRGVDRGEGAGQQESRGGGKRKCGVGQACNLD